jgi:cellulose synthase/poly-beta-1,6-N-acetylglucosamine synthase-like glycosyltransferase
MLRPALSVVVIGRNEGDRLVRCLDSVQSMSRSFGEIELIYVDSNSSDDSAVRAAELGARVIELKNGRQTAARARNAGWHLSSADFILFLDGDTVLHPDFVTRALPEFENPQNMVVWGHRRELHPGASVYNRVLDLNWICPPGLTEFCGGDALMRRSALEQAGGYNPDLIAGEEPDLCRRIRAKGGLISHVDVPMTGHDLAIRSWRQYYTHSFRAGHAYAQISGIYKNTEDPLWRGVSQGNVVRATAYLAAIMGAIFASLVMRSWAYVLLGLICFAGITTRTAFKARSKENSVGTLFLFAIHCHIQQIPIFFGQLRYWLNERTKLRAELIEYKKP